MNDQQLLGWFCEGHTPAGLRQLIHNNLKYWKRTKSKRHHRGWVLPLSADEFRGLAKRVPKPVHKANVGVVTELLGDILNEAAKIGFRRVHVRKRIRKDELGCYSEVFKALRANAVCHQAGCRSDATQDLAPSWPSGGNLSMACRVPEHNDVSLG